MTGARRIFFAACAASLRWIAKGPLGLGNYIADLAAACEERARSGPQNQTNDH